MKLDDYLDVHRDVAPFEAVVVPVERSPVRVRITPVLNGTDCACELSIEVEKSSIEDIEPTARMIMCCGKLDRVARVTLRDQAAIKAWDR